MTAARTKVKPPISLSYTLSATGGFAVTVQANPVASAWPSSYYVLYRNEVELATGLSAPFFRDATALEGQEYEYRFSTVNVNEIESDASGVLGILVPSFPVWESGWGIIADQNTTADISARASDPNEVALTFSRNGGTAPAQVTVSSAGVVTIGAAAAGVYTLIIRASNGTLASDTTLSLTVNATATAPDPPLNFTANATGTDQNALSWFAPATGPQPTDYNLAFSVVGPHVTGNPSANGPWTDIPIGLVTSANHTGLAEGTTYYYRLRAENGGLNSTYVAASATTLDAPDGDADFIIPAGATTWNAGVSQPLVGGGSRLPAAGDIIEIAARNGPHLAISNVVGDENNRITIRGPTTGQAIIRRNSAGGSGNVFTLIACRHFNLDVLSSDPALTPDDDGKRHSVKVMYALNASASNKDNPTAWLKFQGSGQATYNNTRLCRIRGLEIDGGYPTFSNDGIGISTNHNFLVADFPTAWQEDIKIEDCYIHQTQGEGMYIGPNSYLDHRPTAGGREVPLRYIQIRRCRVEDTAFSGIQGKSWFGGTAVTGDETTDNCIMDCIVLRCSSLQDPGHDTSLRILGGSGVIARNWVEDSGGTGITFAASEGTPTSVVCIGKLFSNVVVRALNVAIRGAKETAGSGPPVATPTISIFSNSVLSSTGNDIVLAGAVSPASFIRHNVVGGASPNITPGSGSQSNNTTGTPALFVDTVGVHPNLDLHLVAAAPVGSGTLGTDIANTDYDGDVRVLATADNGAFEFP